MHSRRRLVSALAAVALIGGAASTSTAAASWSDVNGCPLGDLCLYKQISFNSSFPSYRIPDAEYYRCRTVNLSGWTSPGSFQNNQNGHVTTTFWSGYNGSGTVIKRVSEFWAEPYFDFWPVNSITVC